jgi:septal ring-binding cell division protein DamX
MNTLFKPVVSNTTQQTPLNNVASNTTLTPNNNTLSQQQQTTRAAPAFEAIASTQKSSLAPQQKNLRYVPPVFFAGGSLKRKEVPFSSFEPEISRSVSISLASNERRFSGALADVRFCLGGFRCRYL